MGRHAFDADPDFVARFDSRSDWDGARQVVGVAQKWNMPVAFFEVRGGFDNRAEPGVVRHHTAKWRVKGAPVFASVQAGQKVAAPLVGAPVCLQSRGSQARYWSSGDMDCAHIYWSDTLIRDLASELHEEGGDRADLLYDDVAFAEDQLLATLSHGYFSRALYTTPPSALEMDARSLALATHLVTQYSALAGARLRRLPSKLTAKQLSRAMDLFSSGSDVSLRLADVAREVALSPFHFCRAFRNTVGRPPHRWLLDFRIDRAQTLLRDTKLSVATISADLGYDDPSYFARLFGKYTGLSPTAYRDRVQG